MADGEPRVPGEQRQHGLEGDQAVLREGVRRPDLSTHPLELRIKGHVYFL